MTNYLLQISGRIKKHRVLLFYYFSFLSVIYLNFTIFYALIDNPLLFNIIGPSIYTFVNSIIFSLPFFIFNARKKNIFIYLLIIDLILTSNVAYYHYYNNIIPFFSYSNVTNLSEIIKTLPNYFKVVDFIFLLPTVFLFFLYLYLRKINKLITPLKLRIWLVSILLHFSILTICITYILGEVRHIKWEEKFISKVDSQPFFVSYYGLIPLWVCQIISHIYSDQQPPTANEMKFIQSFFKDSYKQPAYINFKNTKKNLIIILVESLNTWAIKYENGKATPFLSRLSKDKDIIYAPNILPQVSHGRSADAQLIVNTGLLPVKNNTVANLYATQYYPSLAEAFKNSNYHYSLTIMGNKATCWNQKTMNLAYHIDTLISQENLNSREIIGMGIADKSIFKQAAKILEKIHKPFYCQLITLSSHDAINFNNTPTKLKFPAKYSTETINYLKSIEYVDSSIELFFNELKKRNLFNNSIIVITGDHNGLSSENIREITPNILNKNEKKNVTFTPLIIVNSGYKYKQDENHVFGEIDIYPSILSIMGLNKYFWRGVGNSFISKFAPTFAVDHKLNFIGDNSVQNKNNVFKQSSAWTVSDLIIRKKILQKK